MSFPGPVPGAAEAGRTGWDGRPRVRGRAEPRPGWVTLIEQVSSPGTTQKPVSTGPGEEAKNAQADAL